MPSPTTRAQLRLLRDSPSATKDVAAALQAIRALVGSVGETARAVEQQTGITNAQLFLLHQIADGTDLSVNELAERAMTHQSTASIVLSRLERRGLVERVRSAADARRVVLRLTPDGARLLKRSPTPPTSRMVDALCTLQPGELRAITRGLAALGRAYGFDVARPRMLFQDPAIERAPRARARKARPARGK